MRKVFWAALAALFICASASAQGTRFTETALRPTAGIAGATVRVCTETAAGTPCAPLASIYSDRALTLLDSDSIVTADSLGNFGFYALPGCYKWQVSAPGFSTTTEIVCNGIEGLTSPITTPNPVAFDVNLQFKGPNPYRDVTRYGVRAVDPNVAPVTAGITANCTIASATVAISAASTFQNGDGVVIYGCGAPHSMTTPSAPTVTPKLAAAGTGTGIVVNAPAGGTTYNYQIVVRNKAGGLTAASAVGSTTTGAAALGSQSVGISTLARANAVVTVTTSAAHGLAIGANVLINGTSDSANFGGWYIVDTVADNTHFTFSSGMDTRNGAAAAATGGTVFWFNANRITVPAVTGAWEFYFYRGTTFIGVGRPQGTTVTDLTYDDFGTTMMANMSLPGFVPATPPGVATSNHLVTTIVSGAGTTTLTLAAAAGTTVSGASIRFDNAPNILTAANAAAGSGTLYFPAVASGSYVVSSYLTMPFPLAVSQAGPLYLNETVEFNQNTQWYGFLAPQPTTGAAFGWQGGPTVTVNTANPGVYLNGSNSTVVAGLKFAYAGSNGALLMLLDMGTNNTWDTVSFSTGGSLDYMGVGLLQRAITGGTFSVILNKVTADGGPSVVQGASATPLIYFDKCGVFTARHLQLSRRGFFFRFAPAGADVTIDSGRMQGGLTPALNFYNSGGAVTANIAVQYDIDTMAHAIVANLSAADGDIIGGLLLVGGNSPSVDGATAPGKITGRPFSALWSPAVGILSSGPLSGHNIRSAFFASGTATDGVFATATGARYASQVFNAGVNVGNPYSLFINGAQPGKPAGTVAAGGSVPIGDHTYHVVPFWWNNADGVYSVSSDTITTTSGNQTVNLTWTAVAGNPKGYNIYRDGSLLIGTVPNVPTNSFSDTLGFVGGGGRSTLPAGGPSYINRDEIGALQIRLSAGEFAQRYIPPTLALNSVITGPNFATATLASLNNAETFTAVKTFAEQIVSTKATGTAPLSITSTTPVPNLTVSNHPKVQFCGTTTTCSATAQVTAQIVYGSAALVSGTPSTATITGISPAFTSSTSYVCTLAAQSAAATALLSVANVSGSSFTITGPNTVTTVINYTCSGN
jgi:hypothetical protein